MPPAVSTMYGPTGASYIVSTPVQARDTILLLPAMAGGAPRAADGPLGAEFTLLSCACPGRATAR